jgi:hypothetical protein
VNTPGIIFLVINALLILALPRAWASLPVLITACYITRDLSLDIGPFTFTGIRIIVAFGVLRLILRGERLRGGLNGLDKLMLAWGTWLLISSLFHKSPSETLVFYLGLTYNAFGIYFLIRAFVQSLSDLVGILRITAILLGPVALGMLFENVMHENVFYAFWGGRADVGIREGVVRARGPFAHAILAGTVGAVSLPMMVSLWKSYKQYAILGIVSSVAMIITCGSSGPILSAIAGIGGLFMWYLRQRMCLIPSLDSHVSLFT